LDKIGHIPSADNDAPGVGIAFEGINDLGNLVDVLSIGSGPAAPLNTIHRAQVAIFFGPFVPDGDASLFKPIVIA
jgi:hypothetical protein